MLVINPQKRITVEEALNHEYFAEFHDEAYEPVCDRVFQLDVDYNTMTIEKLRVREWRGCEA